MTERNTSPRDDNSGDTLKSKSILDGVANILSRLGELAEKGEQLRSQVGTEDSQHADSKGVFDFSVKFGNANPEHRTSKANRHTTTPPVTPLRKESKTNAEQTPIETLRKPVIYLFEEDNQLRVIAEMPGATAESIAVQVEDGSLLVSGRNSKSRFEDRISINVDEFKAPVYSLNNGVLEVTLDRAQK